MAAVAAGSPAAIPDLRQRVLSLLARPAVEPPEAPQLQQPTREEEVADVLSQQRWLVRAEPTDAGLVPTLCVRQKKLLGRRLPVVIVLHGTGGSKDEMLPHLRRYANTESVAALIEAGADVDMVVRNEQGEHITALDIVERYGEDSERHAGTLALLRKAGARHAAEVESGEAKADL